MVMNAKLTPLNVAVVGATGMVGRTMLDVLEARDFPVARLLPVASAQSVGKTVRFNGEEVAVMSIEDALTQTPHVALFSAGGALSTEWAPNLRLRGSRWWTTAAPGGCRTHTSWWFPR